MDEEPQPEFARSNFLDSALFGFRMVWASLFLGSTLIALIIMGVVIIREFKNDLGDIAYLFTLPAPLGLLAYLIIPKIGPKTSQAFMLDGKVYGRTSDPLGERGSEDDLHRWFPTYASQFFLRLGVLECPIIIALIGFLLSANWIVLFTTLPLFAAMIAELPLKGHYMAWVDSVKSRVPDVNE